MVIKTNMNVSVELTPDGFVDAFQSNYERLTEFIKEVDMSVADWDFTEELYKHFAKMHKVYLKEVKDRD